MVGLLVVSSIEVGLSGEHHAAAQLRRVGEHAAEQRLGGAGLRVGPLGFGCWRLVAMSPAEARERVEAALDSGMNLVDTADVYGLDWGGEGFGAAESLLGRVLAEAPELRGRMVLASKGGIRPPVPYDSSREGLVAACEASLSRLGVDCIDLYQIHRVDRHTPIEETLAALDLLVTQGTVRSSTLAGRRNKALRMTIPPW